MKLKHKKNGFSLMELVVYIGIASLIILVLAGSIIQISRVYSRAKAYQTISQNGNNALRKLTQEIMASSTINLDDSNFTSEPNILALNSLGNNYRRFYVATNASGKNQLFLVSEDSSPALEPQAITSQSTNVEKFVVDYNDTVPESFKITLTLSGATPQLDVEETYYTTVNLRNY